MNNQERIKKLSPLFDDYEMNMTPADAGVLSNFIGYAVEKCVPMEVVEQTEYK